MGTGLLTDCAGLSLAVRVGFKGLCRGRARQRGALAAGPLLRPLHNESNKGISGPVGAHLGAL